MSSVHNFGEILMISMNFAQATKPSDPTGDSVDQAVALWESALLAMAAADVTCDEAERRSRALYPPMPGSDRPQAQGLWRRQVEAIDFATGASVARQRAEMASYICDNASLNVAGSRPRSLAEATAKYEVLISRFLDDVIDVDGREAFAAFLGDLRGLG
jgi:hypothetical protein